MNGSDADSFWAWATTLYARAGVAETLLALQDRHGADVNILLYATYLGACHGNRLDEAGRARLRAAVERWSTIAVRPLRELRRTLKPLAAHPPIARFRAQVQALELDAERMAQQSLVAALPPSPGRADLAVARANLALCLDHDAAAAIELLVAAASSHATA